MADAIYAEFPTAQSVSDYMMVYRKTIIEQCHADNAAALRLFDLYALLAAISNRGIDPHPYGVVVRLCAEAIEAYELSVGQRQPEQSLLEPCSIAPVCPDCKCDMVYVADGTHGYLYECQACDSDFQIMVKSANTIWK